MKRNLWILPTDKPSRLAKSTKSGLNAAKKGEGLYESGRFGITTQNIYITSDEEIKDVRPHKGKWQLEKGEILNKFPNYLTDLSECRLVIMTTDQDLIKDGVQAIDDEFLEWFVKNPSCEEVYVKDIRTIPALQLGSPNGHLMYEIIIPKEEPKQDFPMQKLIDIMENDEELRPKQETLEEAAINNYKELYEGEPLTQDVPIDAFIKGAKWQQEKSYSEEEVNEIIAEAWNSCEDNEGETFTEVRKRILEQFKNK